ncbi:MAG: hypothetical protein QOD54_1481 [Sphingomonadales bacterium]|nr:hypothetical protein [Sphingomonadales bacterium]
MPLIAGLASPHRSRFARRGVLAVGGIAIAAAVSVATLSNPWLGHAVRDGISESLHGVQTVAAMLAERSPGARPEGALANLKHKRQAALHERALPKIRSPFAPPTAYEALASPPPGSLIVPPPQAPLFSTIAGGPTTAVPPANGATPGGPPLLSDIPTPGGGGGGGVFSPPVTLAAPQAPPTLVESVPEPASWAMMLLGFALMGRALRRRSAAGLQAARE